LGSLASQEAIANQMREMKEMLESQRQALPIKTEVPARRASPEDNTIASLRTEIKALHAMLLDTHTADSMANTTLYGHRPCIPFHSARFFIFVTQLADELK